MRGHRVLGESLKDRLARGSRPTANGCVEWAENRIRQGYGIFQWRKRKQYAHRLAFEAHVGPIPAGAFVCHRCDNPACINAEHLFIGSASDNMRDMAGKGRQRGPRGERHHLTHLDSVAVECLRVTYATGAFTQAQLGKWWGINQRTVSKICAGQHWRTA